MKELSIKDAKYIEEYKICLKFNDGKENVVDFKPFLFNSFHPDTIKYQNKELFKKFTILNGDLEWNDFELAFPVFDLYKNKL